MKRLPDAEFEVMKAIWELNQSVNAVMVMNQLEQGKDRKIQTVITLLTRLCTRGFLSSEKAGRDRMYLEKISKEEYLRAETKNFIKQYHANSFIGFVNTLYGGSELSEKELDELMQWLKERKD